MLKTIKRTIKHNFLAKLMAVVFSVVLWLFVMENENPTIERNFTLPIEVAKAPEDCEYTLSKKNVKIRIAAKRIYFATLNTEKMRATVDLSESGNSGIVEKSILIELPKGYESVEKNLDKVRVTLDPYVMVPIMVDIKERGSSQDISRVATIEKTESMKEIKGVAKNTAKVHRLTGYVDLIGKEADFEQSVILIPVDEAGSEVSGVEVINPTTYVKVKMKRPIISKNVSVEPIMLEKNAMQTVSVTPAFVEITGEEKVVENITEIQTEPIKISGEGNINAKIILPDGVKSKINSVTVNVKK